MLKIKPQIIVNTLILLTLITITGCKGASTVFGPIGTIDRGKKIPYVKTKVGESGIVVPASIYPTDKDYQKSSLNIEVLRDDYSIWFDNRSAKAFDNVKIFLNMEYAATLENLPIGLSEKYDLHSFVNKHGEEYPTAVFLNPERDKLLVSTDLIKDKHIYRLTVRLPKDWQKR